jgi:hypothetical protein
MAAKIVQVVGSFEDLQVGLRCHCTVPDGFVCVSVLLAPPKSEQTHKEYHTTGLQSRD